MLEGLLPVVRLGQGGEGAVWLARDPALSRFVAVKVVRIAGASREAGQRVLGGHAPFAQEVDPGLATLFASGLSDEAPAAFRERFGLGDGLWLYVVLAYVHGLDAQDLGGGRPLPAKVVAALGAEIARVLERLHARGLAHLDLKPQNVLVDARGRVVLVDFHSTTHAGTGGYAAPEQAGGEGGPEADWFALGRTLLSVWTGEPLEAGRPLPDVPEPAVSLSGAERRAHGALGELLERLCSRDRGERKGNAGEFEQLAGQLGATDRESVLAEAVAASPRKEKLDEIEAQQSEVATANPREENPLPQRGRGKGEGAPRSPIALALIAAAVLGAAWALHSFSHEPRPQAVVAKPAPVTVAAPAPPPAPSEPAPEARAEPKGAPPSPTSCALGEIVDPDLAPRFLCSKDKRRPNYGSIHFRVEGPVNPTVLAWKGHAVWRLADAPRGTAVTLELVPHKYTLFTPSPQQIQSTDYYIEKGLDGPDLPINGNGEPAPSSPPEWNERAYANAQQDPRRLVNVPVRLSSPRRPRARLHGPVNVVRIDLKGPVVLTTDSGGHACDAPLTPIDPSDFTPGFPLELPQGATLWACPSGGKSGPVSGSVEGYRPETLSH